MRAAARSLSMSLATGACVAAMSSALLGCGTGLTYYPPGVVARGELTLQYDNEFQLRADGRVVAYGHHYTDLPAFVRCVPKASEHALSARSDGIAATTLSTLGIVFGVGGMGGLGGLAYYKSNPELMAGFLGVGIGTSVLGVVLAGISRIYKTSAHGHAVDAMNYYNDAVGSLGASCNDLTYPPSAGPEPPPQAPPSGGSKGTDDTRENAPPKQEDTSEPETPPPPPPPATDIPIH